MFCTKCGSQIKEGASFCAHCGAPVKPASPGTQAPQPAQPPQRPQSPYSANTSDTTRMPDLSDYTRQPRTQPGYPQPQPRPARAPQQSGAYPRPAAKKSNTGLIIGIVAAVVVVIALVFLALWFLDLPPFADSSDRDSDRVELDDSGRDSIRDKDKDKDDEKDPDPAPDEPDEPEDPWPDSVPASQFTSSPAAYDGQDISINATVTAVAGDVITAHVGSGDGLDVYLDTPSAVLVSPGDPIYISGAYRFVGSGAGYFEDAAVTVTGGERDGVQLATTSQIPRGIAATVTDYYMYLGSFSTATTVDDFTRLGGPLVQLTVDGADLRYTVSCASTYLDKVAQITGTAPMDGSPEIDFVAPDDGWGNTVTGTIHLYAGGYVSLEASSSGVGEWSLATPYTDLVPCQGVVPVIFEPAGETTQILKCVSAGSTATLTLSNWDHGKWHDVMTFSGYLGSNGVSYSKREGDKCTPAGTFDILFAFGTAEMSLSIPYYRVTSGDVWVDDTNSAYYNTYQSDSNPYKDWKSSENLYNKFTKGLSVANIYFDYNGDGMTAGSAAYNGGSDLFIDGIGSSGKLGAGYGDIKISSSDMLQLLPLLESARHPQLVIS